MLLIKLINLSKPTSVITIFDSETVTGDSKHSLENHAVFNSELKKEKSSVAQRVRVVQ